MILYFCLPALIRKFNIIYECDLTNSVKNYNANISVPLT